MSTKNQLSDSELDAAEDARMESCPACERETPHRVTIEIREEGNPLSVTDRRMKYSREPYRITTCFRCERTAALRLNDA